MRRILVESMKERNLVRGYPISTTAQKAFARPLKQLITVVGLYFLPPLKPGCLLQQLHAAIHFVVLKHQLSSCSTGQLNIPPRLCKMSQLPSGQTDLPCKPQVLAQGRLAYGLFGSTSPSIYLVYKGLSAAGPCGIKGPTHARLTYLTSNLMYQPGGMLEESKRCQSILPIFSPIALLDHRVMIPFDIDDSFKSGNR